MQQHHARIILTDIPADFAVDGNAKTEIYRLDTDSIGIDQIRDIVTEAHRRPKDGYDSKHIVLTGFKITSESQQASLKILEETPKDVYITVVLPVGTQLLDTVLSRVELEKIDDVSQDVTLKAWLQLSYKDRIAEIEAKTKAKDTAWMQSMKSGLEKYSVNQSLAAADGLKELEIITENLLTRGASNKMLLEHLALSLPLTR